MFRETLATEVFAGVVGGGPRDDLVSTFAANNDGGWARGNTRASISAGERCLHVSALPPRHVCSGRRDDGDRRRHVVDAQDPDCELCARLATEIDVKSIRRMNGDATQNQFDAGIEVAGTNDPRAVNRDDGAGDSVAVNPKRVRQRRIENPKREVEYV